jgi:hypothetical protein
MDDGSLIMRFAASGQLEMAWHLYAWGIHGQVGRHGSLQPFKHAFMVLPGRGCRLGISVKIKGRALRSSERT